MVYRSTRGTAARPSVVEGDHVKHSRTRPGPERCGPARSPGVHAALSVVERIVASGPLGARRPRARARRCPRARCTASARSSSSAAGRSATTRGRYEPGAARAQPRQPDERPADRHRLPPRRRRAARAPRRDGLPRGARRRRLRLHRDRGDHAAGAAADLGRAPRARVRVGERPRAARRLAAARRSRRSSAGGELVTPTGRRARRDRRAAPDPRPRPPRRLRRERRGHRRRAVHGVRARSSTSAGEALVAMTMCVPTSRAGAGPAARSSCADLQAAGRERCRATPRGCPTTTPSGSRARSRTRGSPRAASGRCRGRRAWTCRRV